MRYRYAFAFVLLYLLVTSASAADEEGFFSGFRLALGVSSKSLDFDVYEKGKGDPAGTLTESRYNALFLSFGSPYRFFADSNLGYYWEYGFSSFRMTRQVVGSNEAEVDLGTSVHGRYVYGTPVLFYRFGDDRHGLILGAGVGLGYLKARGSIVLTEVSGQPRHDVDVSGVDWAYGILIDYRYRGFIVRARGFGPSLTRGGFEYDIFDYSLDVGYEFTFR